MRKRNWFALMVAMIMCLGLAGGAFAEGEKLFDEPVTLNMMHQSHPSWPLQEDWYVLKMLSEDQNVNFNLTTVPVDGFEEKLNLVMASGDLPDLMFLNSGNPVRQYGSQGAFVNMLDYIDQMPNFKAWYEENTDFALNYMAADGAIYQMPEQGVDETNRRGWMYRKDVFDALGLEIPTNADELYDVLVALKEAYPDSYPLASRSFVNNLGQLLMIAPSWGTDHIETGENRYLYLKNDSDWTFGPTEDAYRDMLQFFNKLYEEKLVIPNLLTIDTKGWQDVISNGDSFITLDYLSRIDFFNTPMREVNPDFTMAYMPPPAFGDAGVRGFAYSAKGTLGFVVGSTTKQMDNVIKYLDWLYTDEGKELMSWGREGDLYEEVNGERKWKTFKTAAEMKQATGFETFGFYQLYDFDGELSTFSPETKAAVLEAREYDLPQQPILAFNEEEQEVANTIGVAIETYVAEQASKFILGERSFDTWDDYVKEVENMGIEELKAVHESAYARKLEAKAALAD